MAHETKNILINSIHDRELKKFAPIYLKGRMVDIGCGTKPFHNLLAPYVTEHIGVDHEGTMHEKSKVDLFGTAYDIPSIDEYYDSAICTAVLEHLEEPEQAIRECFRILKPGSYAIYSVPFIWHLHEEPRDFFRYSKYGLKYLFEKVYRRPGPILERNLKQAEVPDSCIVLHNARGSAPGMWFRKPPQTPPKEGLKKNNTMQEILIRKLHEYISENNPDLLLTLQQENKVTEYLHSTVSSVDGLINELLQANKPTSLIEELCINDLTKTLKPSRFNYLKAILEEEFPGDFEKLLQNGLLKTEIINMISICEPVFDELGFSIEKEDDRYLRYAVTGAVHEYIYGL
jgi:SAM-dependent methyltransferase